MIRPIFVPFIDAFGGVERLVLGLSRLLHHRNLPHAIVCFRDTLGLAKHATWHLPVLELGSARNPLSESLAVRRLVASTDGSGVLVFDLKGAFYNAFVTSSYHLHLTDPPSLLPADQSKHAFSFRGASSREISFATRIRAEAVHRINRRGVRRAATTITMSNAIAREVREMYGVDSTVIRPGVPEATTRRPGGPSSRSMAWGPRMLSVSRLEPTKRLDWLLRAFRQLIDGPVGVVSWDNASLDLVGGGPARDSLSRLAAELRLQHQVRFHGIVSDSDIERLYAEADLFAMPAAQGYGLPALEAINRGVPVVLHRDSGVSEILDQTSWAEVVSDGSGSDLAGGIERLALRIARGQLAGAGRPRVPTESAWAEQVCRTIGWLPDRP